mgnify:CR=1 FL=1
MKKATIVLLALMIAAAGAAPAYAMRCGTDLITESSTKFEVLQACGQPLKKFGGDVSLDDEGLSVGGYEKWYYDVGGGVYHVITFHGTEVFRIEIVPKE